MSDSPEKMYTQAEADAVIAAALAQAQRERDEIHELRERGRALWAELLRRSLDSAISSSKTYHRSVLTNRCIP